jgi:hypothetical protein
MLLILGLLVAVGTVIFGIMAVAANMATDAPSVQSTSVTPIFVIGFGVAAVLILVHFVGV